MYNLVIGITCPPSHAQLAFHDEGLMKAAREKIRSAIKTFFEKKEDTYLSIKDDYENCLDVWASNISTVLMQNNEINCERTNDNNVDQQRANMKFLEKRNNDMELMRLFPGNTVANMGRA